MKVLVTGGAGFVGTNLISRLKQDGHSVISIDNYSTGLKSNHVDGVYYIDGDIKEDYLYSVLDFEIVFHLAAIARIQPSFRKPIKYFETNALGTMKLADYCSRKNIPIVYAGSSSHHSGKFKNPYTFTKDIGEEIIQLYQTHYKLNASIARFYNVYGPNQLKDGSYCTLIGIWEKCMENNLPLKIYGDGTKRRDFTHVSDIVDGLCKIVENNAWGYTFEFGRGENHSVKEISDIFGADVIYENDKPGEAFETLCDISFAKEKLNWEPKINIEDYIKDFLKKLEMGNG